MAFDAAAGKRRRGLVAIITGLALGLLAAIAVVAVGDDEEGADFDVPAGVEPLGDARAGSVAQLAACSDWVEGSPDRKRATVVDIRQQLSGGGTIEGRPSLTDQEAYETFDRACANDFAKRFHLYKIYFRANAFAGFDPNEVANPEG